MQREPVALRVIQPQGVGQDLRGLAERYAVNTMGVYQHYRWRAHVQECAARGVSLWQGLARSDRWQARYGARKPELMAPV